MTADEVSSPAPPVTDAETIRDSPGVAFHEDSDVVGGTTFDAVRKLEDTAVTGVTRGEATLLTRSSRIAPFQLPTAVVEPDEDYTEVASRQVESQIGSPVRLESVEAVWRYDVRLEDSARTASRTFVVYSGAPATDDRPIDLDAGDAADAGWFDELPADVDEVPGTHRFFD